MAVLIFSLAKETGWSEEKLLWDIPCHRVNDYWHACLRSHDIWTVEIAEPIEDSVQRLETLMAQPHHEEVVPDLF